MDRKTWILKLTEIATFLIPAVTFVGGVLYIYEHANDKITYQNVVEDSVENSLGHQIIISALLCLIAFQLLRLLIITVDFAQQKDWPYVGMGSFILLVLLMSLSLAWL